MSLLEEARAEDCVVVSPEDPVGVGRGGDGAPGVQASCCLEQERYIHTPLGTLSPWSVYWRFDGSSA